MGADNRRGERDSATPSTWPGDLLFTATVAALSALLVLRVFPGLLDGLLVDTDSYMRLVRVRQLAGTGEWFDGGVIRRSNAPFGSSLHWTRPVDVLILLGGWLLTPFLGFERALHLAGVLLSPVLLIAVCFTTARAVRPLAGTRVRYYAMIAVLAQVGLMGYALPGRADHHLLILLAFVAMNGAALRLFLESPGRWAGWAAGAWAAFGLWISTEFLVPLAVLLATLAAAWAVRGRELASGARSVALGLLGVTALAVLVEHPPSALSVAEYDRISVVHLFLAGLTAGFWAGAASPAASRLGLGGRFGYVAVGGLLAAGLVRVVFPGFFGGPMVDVDPELRRSWLPFLTEYQPYLVPHGVADLGRIVAYLGHALLAVGVIVYGLLKRPWTRWTQAWVLLGAGLGVFIPLGIRWVRFVPYAELLGVLGTMVLLARALRWMEGRLSGVRLSAARVSTTAGLLAGPILLGAVVMAVGGEAGGAVQEAGRTQAGSCPVEALVAALNDPGGVGDRPRTVLAHVDLGPMLLYRTPHAVVGTPYHRNARGILDTYRIMHATETDEARRRMAQRGIDVVVPCGFQTPPARVEGGTEPFVSLLRRGAAPAWLIRHPVSDAGSPSGTATVEGEGSAVYEVVSGEGLVHQRHRRVLVGLEEGAPSGESGG